MRARRAGFEDIPALKALWREAFGDDEGCIDDYFEKRFEPSQTFVMDRDGAPASMLTALPGELLTDTGAEPAAYIYAVGTAQSARGRGLSTALLEYAAAELKAEGFAASVLVPAETSLFDFYGKRGYRPFCDICQRELNAGELPVGLAKLVPVDGGEYAGLRDDYLARPGYFRWDGEAVSYALSEAEYFGGGAFYFSTKENEGAALCVPEKETLLIKELALAQWDWEDAAAAAGQLMASFGAKKALLRLPAGALPGETGAFAMYEPLKEDYAAPEGAYFSLALD